MACADGFERKRGQVNKMREHHKTAFVVAPFRRAQRNSMHYCILPTINLPPLKKISMINSPLRSQFILPLAAAAVLFQGCFGSRITIAQSDASPATDESVTRQVVNEYLWGLYQNDIMVQNCVVGCNGMQAVHVWRNVWESLVSWASLGIYSPFSIEWACAKSAEITPTPKGPPKK